MIVVLVVVIVGALLALVLLALKGGSKKGEPSPSPSDAPAAPGNEESTPDKNKKRGNASKIKDYTKKLSHNPHDARALIALSDIYFEDNNYTEAFPLYDTLFGISGAHSEVDVFKTGLRLGICALKEGDNAAALKGLASAYQKMPMDYDTNYYFAQALFQAGEWQKCAACLKKVLVLKPESTGINRSMGISLYKLQKYKDCLPYLRHALDENGNDTEVLFSMAMAMEECGIGEKALKIFMHLRADKQYGAQASLTAGMIHERLKQQEAAIADYAIGMKIEGIDPKSLTTICYRMGNCYIALGNVSPGLEMLRKVQSITPSYKDTNALIARYQELSTNSNLQTYLMGQSQAFIAICRKVMSAFYPKSTVHFNDQTLSAEGVEILCTVQSGSWEDTEIFRFYRSETPVGELYVRDLLAKVQESQIDKGVCVTAGSFTDGAKRFADGRPIDLIEKDKLMETLKKVK